MHRSYAGSGGEALQARGAPKGLDGKPVRSLYVCSCRHVLTKQAGAAPRSSDFSGSFEYSASSFAAATVDSAAPRWPSPCSELRLHAAWTSSPPSSSLFLCQPCVDGPLL